MATWTLVYDADCRWCRWAVHRVARADRAQRLRYASFDDARAARLLPGMPDDVLRASWHLVAPEGRAWSGGDAFPPLVALLRGTRAARVFAWPGVLRGTRAAYRWVARNRGWLGRFVPDRPAIRR